MATKQMKTPGAPAAARTKRTPLAPTNGGSAPSGLPFDDASSKIMKGQLRPRGVPGLGGSDSAVGQVAPRTRSATNSSAQFRITSSLPAPQSPEARATQANGRIVPAVMGGKQRQNFDMQRGVL